MAGRKARRVGQSNCHRRHPEFGPGAPPLWLTLGKRPRLRSRRRRATRSPAPWRRGFPALPRPRPAPAGRRLEAGRRRPSITVTRGASGLFSPRPRQRLKTPPEAGRPGPRRLFRSHQRGCSKPPTIQAPGEPGPEDTMTH